MQPIQDQIFNAVQEIAANKKYDFVFDKSADVVMLYSAKRFDISEQVLRSITRSSKRKQLQTRKERKAAKEEELIPEINIEREALEKDLTDKKAAREKAKVDKRNKQLEARDKKKKAIEVLKKKILEDRAKLREAKINARRGTTNITEDTNDEEETLSPRQVRKQKLEAKKKKILADRKAKLEARQKAKDSIAAAKKNN